MAFVYNEIILDNQAGTKSLIRASDDKLSFSGVSDKYEFDEDVYAKNVKLANENDIQNLQSEIDSILPLSNYAYINGNDETSELGGIPFGTGGINTLIQSPDFVYDNVNKVVKVDNVNLATQTQIDFLQTEIDNIPSGNSNSLITTTPLITPDVGSIIISDGASATTTTASNGLKITDILNVDLPLNCNNTGNFNSGVNIQSFSSLPVAMFMDGGDNNNFNVNNTQQSKTSFTNSSEYNFDNVVKINELECSLTATFNNGLLIQNTSSDPVSIYMDENKNFNINNSQPASKTIFSNSSSYEFDNDLKVGDFSTTKKIYVNDVELNGVSQGMLRALNLNLLVPTVEQTFDIHWTSLTPSEKLAWKGGDATTSDPIQSATGNYWSFQKGVSNTKINWVLPIDLSIFTFQELQSVWAIVKFNNSTSVSTEGSVFFQIQAGVEPTPPYYRTRWTYSNSAIPVNQFQYYYKIYCLDTITTSTTQNFGKGQEVDQQKFKGNPCNVEPNLWSIAFNKLVGSPTGILSPAYTLQPISSVALNTASNINNINIDVVAFGVNNYRFNLFYN